MFLWWAQFCDKVEAGPHTKRNIKTQHFISPIRTKFKNILDAFHKKLVH